MKLKIYIAGPISKGDLCQNIRQADAAFFALLRAGFAPHCSHWSCFAGSAHHSPYSVRTNDTVFGKAHATPHGTTHADWMGVDLPWVAAADAVLRLPGESAGADLETAHAAEHGVPVFESVEAVVAWGKAREGVACG